VRHVGRYRPLPDNVRLALESIESSRDGDVLYYPCAVRLKNGETLQCVYVIPEVPYMRQWGIYPEDDKGKSWIRIEDVAEVKESLTRLPARFATELYQHGESGMGYTIFTIVFRDGYRQACVTGNAVDFIRYPPGLGPEDVVAVLPHVGRRDDSPVRSPHWTWCLYSE
jgi:hypothetical protein